MVGSGESVEDASLWCGVSAAAKAKSGLVWVFHLEEWKLGCSLGSYRSRASALEAHSLRASPSADVWLYPQSICWQLKSPAYMAGARTSGRADVVNGDGGGLYTLTTDVSWILVISH